MMPLLAAANLRCSRAVKASASISARPQATVRESARHAIVLLRSTQKGPALPGLFVPDPAPVGRDIRVSKGGFKGTVLRI